MVMQVPMTLGTYVVAWLLGFRGSGKEPEKKKKKEEDGGVIPTSNSAATKAYIAGLYAAYVSGDSGPSLRAMSDDIEFEYIGPQSVFPFCGPRRGKHRMPETIAEINKVIRLEKVEIDQIMVDGVDVCVQMKAQLCGVVSQQQMTASLVDVMRIDQGKICSLREYWDIRAVTEGILAAPPSAAASS
eukprot:m.159563 g.159563  ORF g.159563 m.159563 type:complete len:186 (-) comp17042_c0_seq1:3145-3702(-)